MKLSGQAVDALRLLATNPGKLVGKAKMSIAQLMGTIQIYVWIVFQLDIVQKPASGKCRLSFIQDARLICEPVVNSKTACSSCFAPRS